MSSKFFANTNFKRKNLIDLSLAVIFVSSTYSVFSFFSQASTINQLTEEFLWQVNTGIQETTRNYLMPAQFISELSSRLVQSGTLSINDTAALESYTAPFSNTYRHLNSFYIGTEKDEFWLWIKHPRPEVNHAIREVKPVDNQYSESWLYYDSRGNLVDRLFRGNVAYRATQRPWYRGAKQVKSNYWTDVYVFNSTNKPGITGSYPIFNNEGHVTGVWGVDIEIQELSRFLADVSVARLGEIAILNSESSVIAYSGVVNLPIDSAQLPSLEDLQSKPLLASLNSFENHGFGYFFVNSDGIRYLASVSPLTFPDVQNWRIVIAIRADKLPGNLLWRTRLNGIIVLIFLGILAVLLMMIRFASVNTDPMSKSQRHSK